MLIPVKCFTCGKVIGDKYEYYIRESMALKKQEESMPDYEIQYLDDKKLDKTAEGQTLDKLNMKDLCCRRHFLTHVNIF